MTDHPSCPSCGRRDRFLLDPLERFMTSVTKRDTGCWEWNAARQSAGYGSFQPERGRVMLAHRFSYEAHHGPIPDGLVVRHKCDNRPCVNPDHLEVGTIADNNRDKVERGRNTWVGRPQKLDAEKVRDIKTRLGSTPYVDLANEYGVSAAAISQIANGRIWKHVA